MKKVAVIGAGIAGTTTAYALVKKGYKDCKLNLKFLKQGLLDR